MTTRHAITPDEATRLGRWVEGLTLPFTLTVSEGKVRSLSQNALLHVWFGVIADCKGDRTLKDVKGACHHYYALDVRLADPQFEWVWSRTGALLDYEQQCALLASETLGVSSKMTRKELGAYLDEMHRDYAKEGISLPHPEDRK